MSFPTVAATNTTNNAVNNPTKAINLPASISSGDLLIIVLAAYATAGAVSITTPSGWSVLFSVVGSGNLRRVAGFYKVASGSEGATVSITFSRNVSCAANSYRITGYTGTPEAGTATTGSSTAPNPPSLSPSWGSGDILWLAVFGNVSPGGTITSPTNYSSGFSVDEGKILIASAQRNLTASSEDPGAFTTSSANWAANTIAIQGIPIVSGDGSASGTGTATGVGAARAAATASSAGVGAASGVGRSTNASTASASGTGAASAVGAATSAATASASGTGAATGVGASISSGVGSAAGTSSASAEGETVDAGSVAEAAGAATALGVGSSFAAATGSASGQGACLAVGTGIVSGVASSDGLSTGVAVGASIAETIAISSGFSTALGVSFVEPLHSRGSFGFEEPSRSRRKSQHKDRERLLDLAIEKALEPPPGPQIDRTPWLFEPVALPDLLDVPEYNPVLAGLYDQAADLQSQLARLKFDRAQEDDDIELLLMALA